ncbi:MAG: light-regulated signal transduction histidine kinase (bacteriophytochrome) [Nitrospinales bacterium]
MQHLKFLLVENNPTDQVAVQRFFKSQKWDHDLSVASSYRQALELLSKTSYDIVLLDYNLGDGTGLELLSKIQDIPVIFISGSSTELIIVEAMKQGAYDFLIKDHNQNYLSLLPSTIEKVVKRKIAEDRLKKYLAELERSNEELRSFAFVASHDLNEPLRKIVGFGERLKNKAKNLDPDARIYASKMQESATRMQNMIQELLQYSLVSAKGDPFRTIDLNKVVKEVLEDLEVSIKNSNGIVQTESLPTVEADPTQMRQLFQNLISNAIKFTKKDEPPKIELVAKPCKKDLWDIFVKDNGIGFDSQHGNSIFQPFFRLHGRSQYEGSGIGLAICKKIVDRHQGKIKAISSKNEGSIFQVTLPVKQFS